MQLSNDKESLGKILRSCRVVVMAATELEARLIEEAIADKVCFELATKPLVVGVWAPVTSAEGRSAKSGASEGLEPLRVALIVTGCDKANTAHALTAVFENMGHRPDLVLQVGIAGALPKEDGGSGADVGDVVVAESEQYSDTGSSAPDGWLSAKDLGLPIAAPEGIELGGVFCFDEDLVSAALDIVREGLAGGGQGRHLAGWSGKSPNVWSGRFVTSSKVTGTDWEAREVARRFGALAESMEGAAGAHVSALYGVPFLEIRGVSNRVGDRERDTWQVERAAAVAAWAVSVLLDRIDVLPLGCPGARSTESLGSGGRRSASQATRQRDKLGWAEHSGEATDAG